jgi:hypothetical protein
MPASGLEDDDWGLDAGPFGEWLAIFSFVFGGLSVAMLFAGGGLSPPFALIVEFWDSILRLVMLPLEHVFGWLVGGLLASGNVAANLYDLWPHVLFATVLMGGSGLHIMARGGAWLIGAVWFAGASLFGLSVIIHVDPSSLASAIGGLVGDGPGGDLLSLAVLTVIVSFAFFSLVFVFSFFNPELLFSYYSLSLLLISLRVFSSLIGGGTFMLLDYGLASFFI